MKHILTDSAPEKNQQAGKTFVVSDPLKEPKPYCLFSVLVILQQQLKNNEKKEESKPEMKYFKHFIPNK